ncbi:MAG: UDP-N-acetylglucosamine 2-epimerase (non-hydrolyzing) [Chloroflexi bacterium]|nr:UDP-N-acetylglucosamine 2-epimerase (non-hydrolyzing) [Chloroflexota bacterium]
MKILAICGTRPEALKMAPVVLALRAAPEFETQVAVTAQHRQMLDQALNLFGIRPDYDLNIMQAGQTIFDITSRTLLGLRDVLDQARPDLVLVQGDTTTVMTGALAAFYMRIPVGHVEAGLRSFDKYQPFPEEINRRITSTLTDLHFAPTDLARRNLEAEGVTPERIWVTGNTAVDALLHVAALQPPATHPLLDALDPARRLILVTTHRRENWGEPLRGICRAVRQLIETYRDIEVIYALHLNPVVQNIARTELADVPRLHLCDAVDYAPWVQMLKRSYLILTDSGGIQEEAPSLGKPVLVLRNVTERPEGVHAGTLKIVGTDTETIVREASTLLIDADARARMTRIGNPYGDGHAAARIVAAIREWAARSAG